MFSDICGSPIHSATWAITPLHTGQTGSLIGLWMYGCSATLLTADLVTNKRTPVTMQMLVINSNADIMCIIDHKINAGQIENLARQRCEYDMIDHDT
jgi:hypothetical protein